MKTVVIVLDGKIITTYHNVVMVETCWVDEFNWYGRVIHLDTGDTASFKNTVEIYERSNIGFVRI